MLDILDFITERGGDPNKVLESQRRRFKPEDVVHEVIALYEEARKSLSLIIIVVLYTDILPLATYEATQIGTKINAVQKEIGQLKKVARHRRRLKGPGSDM